MATITADMIKQLRERTGVGMGKCKEALEQAGGDMDLAIDNLRKAGIASAVKKESRDTKEGMILAKETSNCVIVVEANAETDFVVQNERFRNFLNDVAEQILETKPADLDALMNAKFIRDPSLTVDEFRAGVMQSLGENIKIRRFQSFMKKHDESIGVYSHMNGKILTLVKIEGASGLETLAKEIGMHIAAESPSFLNPSEVPETILEKEREIALSQVQGKPANITEKIVEGKIKAFLDAECLVCQKYVKDNSLSVAEVVEQEGKKLGKQLKLALFIRWQVGV